MYEAASCDLVVYQGEQRGLFPLLLHQKGVIFFITNARRSTAENAPVVQEHAKEN